MFVTSSSRHILPTTVTFTLTLVLSLHCDGWRLLLLLLYFVHGTAGLQRDEKLRLSVYPCGACFLFVTSSGHSSNLHILPTTVTFTLTLRRLFVHFVDRGVANAASIRSNNPRNQGVSTVDDLRHGLLPAPVQSALPLFRATLGFRSPSSRPEFDLTGVPCSDCVGFYLFVVRHVRMSQTAGPETTS